LGRGGTSRGLCEFGRSLERYSTKGEREGELGRKGERRRKGELKRTVDRIESFGSVGLHLLPSETIGVIVQVVVSFLRCVKRGSSQLDETEESNAEEDATN